MSCPLKCPLHAGKWVWRSHWKIRTSDKQELEEREGKQEIVGTLDSYVITGNGIRDTMTVIIR